MDTNNGKPPAEPTAADCFAMNALACRARAEDSPEKVQAYTGLYCLARDVASLSKRLAVLEAILREHFV